MRENAATAAPMSFMIPLAAMAMAVHGRLPAGSPATVALPVITHRWFAADAAAPLRPWPDAPGDPPPRLWFVRPDGGIPDDAPVVLTLLSPQTLRRRIDGFLRRHGDATIPGTLVAIDGQGVLIRGAAGCGKSEAALGLLDRGHRLVADDAVRVTGGAGTMPMGEPPPLLRGRLAVRGLGVLDPGRLFGADALLPRVPITLVVNLGGASNTDPLHGAWSRTGVLGTPLPGVAFNVDRPLPLLIETALRRHAANGDAAVTALVRKQRQALHTPQPGPRPCDL